MSHVGPLKIMPVVGLKVKDDLFPITPQPFRVEAVVNTIGPWGDVNITDHVIHAANRTTREPNAPPEHQDNKWMGYFTDRITEDEVDLGRHDNTDVCEPNSFGSPLEASFVDLGLKEVNPSATPSEGPLSRWDSHISAWQQTLPTEYEGLDTPPAVSARVAGATEELHHMPGMEYYKAEGPRMKPVMIQTALGLKPASGGFRGNYANLFSLRMCQHDCMQFCTATENDIRATIDDLEAIDSFKPQNWEVGFVEMYDGKDTDKMIWVRYWKFRNSHGIYCVALEADTMLKLFPSVVQGTDAKEYLETNIPPRRIACYVEWLQMHIINFGATHVLFNDLLGAKTVSMIKTERKVVRVEIIHTLEQIPAGPCAGGMPGVAPSPHEFGLWRDLEGVVAVSEAVRKYAREQCDLDTIMLPNHAFSYLNKETGHFPTVRGNFTKQTVVMVNPAHVKGFNVFLQMAQENHRRAESNKVNRKEEQLPVYNFRCYLSWGTHKDMVLALRDAGVELVSAKGDFEREFDDFTVLVMPSLWCEAWGLIATECQLRGIPVMGADNGGIPESKAYAPPLLPVAPIEFTRRKENGQYIIPSQDASPWIRELDRLMTNQNYYRTIRLMSFIAARDFIENFDYRGMEKFLQKLMIQA